MSPTKTKPGAAVLPDHLAAVPAVAEAAQRLDKARESRESAVRGAIEAREAHEAAPELDKAAHRAAVESGADTPDDTEPIREREQQAALKRLDAANALLADEDVAFRAVLVAHRDALDHEQRPRVEAAAEPVLATLDSLTAQIGTLAAEAGVWRSLHAVKPGRDTSAAAERTRAAGREPAVNPPSFDPARHEAGQHIAALRAEVDRLLTQPTPAQDRQAERRRERAERRAARDERGPQLGRGDNRVGYAVHPG